MVNAKAARVLDYLMREEWSTGSCVLVKELPKMAKRMFKIGIGCWTVIKDSRHARLCEKVKDAKNVAVAMRIVSQATHRVQL